MVFPKPVKKPRESEPTGVKSDGSYAGVILWLLAAVIFYLLLSGPAMRLFESGPLKNSQAIEVIFGPVIGSYENSPLHKPLGMYWHLWDPKDFDKKGEFIIDFSSGTWSFGSPANTPTAPAPQ